MDGVVTNNVNFFHYGLEVKMQYKAIAINNSYCRWKCCVSCPRAFHVKWKAVRVQRRDRESYSQSQSRRGRDRALPKVLALVRAAACDRHRRRSGCTACPREWALARAHRAPAPPASSPSPAPSSPQNRPPQPRPPATSTMPATRTRRSYWWPRASAAGWALTSRSESSRKCAPECTECAATNGTRAAGPARGAARGPRRSARRGLRSRRASRPRASSYPLAPANSVDLNKDLLIWLEMQYSQSKHYEIRIHYQKSNL